MHKPRRAPPKKSSTSWEPVEKWYQRSVGEEGHYYHQHVVLPGVLRLMALQDSSRVLDLACGQGVLARQLPTAVAYVGIDLSPSLVKQAKEQDRNPLHHYVVGDVTKPLAIKQRDLTHAAIVLALQNIEHPEQVLKQAADHLCIGGQLIIVLNHPCFRIPRQSSWQVDAEKKIQYRRLDHYLSPMRIPIQAHPSKGERSVTTWSFHHPLSDYSRWLHEAGFVITGIEEWCSNKVSTGSAAKMENRSRAEFPLFLTFVAKKD